ncbi:hypothetical protein K1719_045428 [Acacia pycnantha]|nr:hypothetical protein K1719_045428 [Acacia pycnantha]
MQRLAFSNYGESWRQKRKLCVLELLSSKRVQSFQFIRDDEIQDLISNMRKSCCVNISEMLSAASNNIICRCIIGQKFDTEESSRFGDLARREAIHLGVLSLGDLFPWLSWVDHVTGKVREFKRNFTELDRFFDEDIAEHKEAKKEDDDEKKDFVDILLQAQECKDQLYFELNQDNFKAILTVITSMTRYIYLPTTAHRFGHDLLEILAIAQLVTRVRGNDTTQFNNNGVGNVRTYESSKNNGKSTGREKNSGGKQSKNK